MSLVKDWPTCKTCGKTVEELESKFDETGKPIIIVKCHGRSEAFEPGASAEGYTLPAEVFDPPPKDEAN